MCFENGPDLRVLTRIRGIGTCFDVMTDKYLL